MENHGSFSALWKAFYSQSLYRDVRQTWGLKSVLYIFWVVLICCLIGVIHNFADFKMFQKEVLIPVSQQVPNMTLTNGKLSIDKPSPYTISIIDDKTHKTLPLFIFDMDNKITDIQKTDAIIIFRKDGYFSQQSKDSVHVSANSSNDKKTTSSELKMTQTAVSGFSWQTYPTTHSFQFTQAEAAKIAENIAFYGPAIFTIFFVLISLVFRLIQALLYALIVLIFGACYRIPLNYGEAYRLAIVAVGPSIFITTLLALSSSHLFMHRWLLAFIIQLLYMFFAAYSNRNISTNQ